ncbi:MAG: toll/interleukin-1 receptor domain-containing protein [Phycisphaerae bacterium]|nr:toll/interleukin-1 receptor domain-containing protein [Phycisphaerae bacterium]
MSSVFLSHNSKDKPWVSKLAERLMSDGVLVWLDEAKLNIGDSLIENISAGIRDMKYVAAVISTNSIDSSWVQKEISLAMSKEIAGRKVTVLPLLIEKCTLPASLIDKLYADFTKPENYEIEYSKLLRALGVGSGPKIANTHQANTRKPQRNHDKPESIQIVDICIVGVVKERTRQDQEFSGLQDYFFQLSAMPPFGWSDFFDKARQFVRHTKWRKAWIEGDCVVVKCALEELSECHLRDLKEDVATANMNYIQAKAKAERQRQIKRERQEKAKMEQDDVLDQLDFD